MIETGEAASDHSQSGRNNSMTAPALTIGLPVYNGSAGLPTALESLLGQSFTNFTLLISDNASTDSTRQICEAAAARDSRIKYTRQTTNVGPAPNFRFVLEHSTTPFFMWAAHDDFWEPTFVEKNMALLASNPKAVASVSKILFHKNGMPVRLSDSTFPLVASGPENMHKFLQNPSDASRFYGIHRAEALKRSFPPIPHFHCYDWLVIALTLREGLYLECPEPLMKRSIAEPLRYVRQVRNDNRTWLTRLFPALRFTFELLRRVEPRYLPSILFDLLQLNVLQHSGYVEYYHPRWFTIEKKLYHRSGARTLLKRFLST
jgi:glycosyltransferase involved in cell wall biosynthesis